MTACINAASSALQPLASLPMGCAAPPVPPRPLPVGLPANLVGRWRSCRGRGRPRPRPARVREGVSEGGAVARRKRRRQPRRAERLAAARALWALWPVAAACTAPARLTAQCRAAKLLGSNNQGGGGTTQWQHHMPWLANDLTEVAGHCMQILLAGTLWQAQGSQGLETGRSGSSNHYYMNQITTGWSKGDFLCRRCWCCCSSWYTPHDHTLPPQKKSHRQEMRCLLDAF